MRAEQALPTSQPESSPSCCFNGCPEPTHLLHLGGTAVYRESGRPGWCGWASPIHGLLGATSWCVATPGPWANATSFRPHRRSIPPTMTQPSVKRQVRKRIQQTAPPDKKVGVIREPTCHPNP
jgi:hypothetical protein